MSTIEIFMDPNIGEKFLLLLNECRKSNKFTDLTLKSSDGHKIRVHKSVLWSASSYYQTMFDSNLKESNMDSIEMKNDIEMQDLELIVEYLYTGIAKVPRSRAKIVFEKANFFQLIELQEFCSKLLVQQIDDENCVEFLRYSDIFVDESLRCGSIEYIAKNADKLLEKYLTELSNDEFEAIISNKQLQISPEKLFTCIKSWVNLDLLNRREYIGRLLKNVDIIKISADFMNDAMKSDDTLNGDNTFSYTLMKMVAETFCDLRSKNNIANKENITVVVNRDSPSIALSDALEMVNQIIVSTQRNALPVHERQPQTIRRPSELLQPITETPGPSKPTRESRYSRKLTNGLPYPSQSIRERPSVSNEDLSQSIGQKRVFIAYHYSIEKLNLVKKKWEQQYLYHTDRTDYAIASNQNNIYLTGGVSPKSQPSSVVHCYSEQQNKITRIPSMLEGRKLHKSICINDQIYSCGGKTNCGSVEYFDIGREIWIKGTQMNKSRYCFGLSSNDDIIYAVGGTNENTIERLDIRQGEWHIIGDLPKSNLMCKSFCMNNLLYCVEPSSKGFIYDLRTSKIQENIFPDHDIKENQISWHKYDVVELEGNAYGIFQNQFYQYDEYMWKNLRPSYLKYSIESINLCTL